MLLQEYSFIAYSSAKHNDFHSAESCPTPVLAAVLTHTVTHTGKRAERVKSTGQEVLPSCPVLLRVGEST